MGKATTFLFVLIGLPMFYSSCKNTLKNEIDSKEEIMALEKKDSLVFGEIRALEETEDMKSLQEKMKQLKHQNILASTFDDYDENFDINMFNIREMPITIQAKVQTNTYNSYLQTNGNNSELTLAAAVNSNAQKFYLKIFPPSSGISYRIYSQQEHTPLSVGVYGNDQNNTVLFTLPNESGSLYSASWNLIPSRAHKGYFVIESSSYLGQIDPNNPESIFPHVVEVQNNNKLGFAKYTERATQEFRILPVDSFIIESIIYDKKSATITPVNPLKIESTSTNVSVEPKLFTIHIDKKYNETSYFAEKRGNLDFNISNSAKTFQRPTVRAIRIVLPESSTPRDATYNTSTIQNIPKTLLFDIVDYAPGNSLIEVTSYIQMYNVSINYTAKAIYDSREIILSGTWHGSVMLDPKIVPPNHERNFFDLTTGKKIIYFPDG